MHDHPGMASPSARRTYRSGAPACSVRASCRWHGAMARQEEPTTTVLPAHLALLTIAVGLVAFSRHWRRGPGKGSEASIDSARRPAPTE